MTLLAVTAEEAPGSVVLPLWMAITAFLTVVAAVVTLTKMLLAEKDKNSTATLEREKLVTTRLVENTEAMRQLAALHK